MRTVHKVCAWIREHQAVMSDPPKVAVPCLQCPATQEIKPYGKCQRACYGLATELMNIVKQGKRRGTVRNRAND